MADDIIELTDEVKPPKLAKLDQMLTILSQPSTWKGFVLILGVIGIDIDPDKMLEIVKALGLLYGTISVIADKH